MLKRWVGSALSVVSFSVCVQAAPNQYLVSSQVFVDGKLVASPKLQTLEGQSASIVETDDAKVERMKFEVTPSRMILVGQGEAAEMRFNIRLKVANRMVAFAPKISARLGEEVVISQDATREIKSKIELRTIVTRAR